MTREAMLRALQADVEAWPQRVKEAAVKKADGAAYVPLARNNEILRTTDPEATYRYMIRTWRDTEDDNGSAGWYRIIRQAGPTLTWEWLMVDEDKPYAPLFDDVRDTVRRALDRDAGSELWFLERDRELQVERDAAERREQVREEMRSGRRARPTFPELDHGR